MTEYRKLEDNSEVIDVMCALVLGETKVKDIVRILKQPQGTVSDKIGFLIKNGIVKKKKWQFEIRWNGLLKLLKSILKSELSVADKKYLKLFDDDRLKRMIVAYAKMVVQLKHKSKSLRDMVWMYLLGMSQMNGNELNGIDGRFVDLKKDLLAMSEEKYLFLASEE